jgi:hypothetical protein
MRAELSDWPLLFTAVAIGVVGYAAFALILVRSVLRDMFSLLRSARGSAAQAPGE